MKVYDANCNLARQILLIKMLPTSLGMPFMYSVFQALFSPFPQWQFCFSHRCEEWTCSQRSPHHHLFVLVYSLQGTTYL